MAKQTKEEKKIEKVMHEFKKGSLKSSSGEVVTDRKQALAIAMSEANKKRPRSTDDLRKLAQSYKG